MANVMAKWRPGLLGIDQEAFDCLEAVGDHSSADRRARKNGVRDVEGPGVVVQVGGHCGLDQG